MTKRITAAVAILSAMVGTANAALSINWGTPAGFTLADGTTPIVATGNALLQLIYSPDAVAGVAGLDGSATGDTILDQAVVDVNLDGFGYAIGYSDTYSGAYQAGFVYIRAFQSGTAVGSTPAGSQYFSGPMFATINNPGGATPPDDVNAGDAGTGTGDFGTYRLNQVVAVPEPATYAFIGIGALMAAVRRMRRS